TLGETSEAAGKSIVVLNKVSKVRFLPAGPLHPEYAQLINMSGEEMELVHDGPTFAGPHVCILARRVTILTRKSWDRKAPFFA
ncbi:TAT-dependent nitrous-oxide reductase, partial [Pseudomonas aeruginosa]